MLTCCVWVRKLPTALLTAGKYDYNKDREGEEGEVRAVRCACTLCCCPAAACPGPSGERGSGHGADVPSYSTLLVQDVNKDDAGEDLADALQQA